MYVLVQGTDIPPIVVPIMDFESESELYLDHSDGCGKKKISVVVTGIRSSVDVLIARSAMKIPVIPYCQSCV